jgi:hypothetical protein
MISTGNRPPNQKFSEFFYNRTREAMHKGNCNLDGVFRVLRGKRKTHSLLSLSFRPPIDSLSKRIEFFTPSHPSFFFVLFFLFLFPL